MIEIVDKVVTGGIAILKEIYSTPLALPMFGAVLWRAYAGTFRLSALLNACLTASLTIILWPNSVPFFLAQQQGAFESFLRHFSPEVREVVRSWHIENSFLSPRAALFGFTFFSVLVTTSKKRPWYKYALAFVVLSASLTLLMIAWWFTLIIFVFPALAPTEEQLANVPIEQTISAFHHGVELFAGATTMAAAYSMSTWILGCFAFTFVQRHRNDWLRGSHYRIVDRAMVIVITIIILGFALSGFSFLPPYQATLWLLFWILAYPVALSFTRARPLQGSDLIDLYKAGVKQIPFLGDLLSKVLGWGGEPPKASENVESTTVKDSDAPPREES